MVLAFDAAGRDHRKLYAMVDTDAISVIGQLQTYFCKIRNGDYTAIYIRIIWIPGFHKSERTTFTRA